MNTISSALTLRLSACLMLSILLHVAGSKTAFGFDTFSTQMFAICDVAVVGAGATNKKGVFQMISTKKADIY